MTKSSQYPAGMSDAGSRHVGDTTVQSVKEADNDQRPAPRKSKGKPHRSAKSAATKSELIQKRLRTQKGATIDALAEATGWQAHSIRGFLSGTIKKRLGLPLTSDVGKDGKRRYRLAEPTAEAE